MLCVIFCIVFCMDQSVLLYLHEHFLVKVAAFFLKLMTRIKAPIDCFFIDDTISWHASTIATGMPRVAQYMPLKLM